MLDREPFLKAIFAAPDDDVPRLVFADWLDEHGDAVWAELIRVQCELAAGLRPAGDRFKKLTAREGELLDRLAARPHPEALPFRGFVSPAVVAVAADLLADADAFRAHACDRHPEWYGATRLVLTAGRIIAPEPLATILASPVTEHVTALDLSGRIEPWQPAQNLTLVLFSPPFDMELHEAVTPAMVQVLVGMRECRRLTELDLRNNDLDDDTARALVRSPHLFRLRTLYLFDGNQVSGRSWQRVLERFGPDVVQ